MAASNVYRFLRGAVGNAAVWGAGWFAVTLAVSTAVGIMGNSFSWTHTWQMAARVGVIGGLAGGAFSTLIGLVYRGRRLSEISWWRFGLGGGVVGGVFVPGLMIVGRTLSGDGPLPMENWISSAVVAAVLGAVAAGGSMRLAQRASRAFGDERPSGIDGAADPDLLAPGNGLIDDTIQVRERQRTGHDHV